MEISIISDLKVDPRSTKQSRYPRALTSLSPFYYGTFIRPLEKPRRSIERSKHDYEPSQKTPMKSVDRLDARWPVKAGTFSRNGETAAARIHWYLTSAGTLAGTSERRFN